MTKLTDLVVAAIRKSLSHHPGDVGGYAVVVDPDMTTLLGVSISPEQLARDEGARFLPVDWPTEYHSEAFGMASDQLADTVRLEYGRRVAELVDSLVEALQRAREAEERLKHAILMVACADGGGVWQEAEGSAIRRLNGPADHEAWSRQQAR